MSAEQREEPPQSTERLSFFSFSPLSQGPSDISALTEMSHITSSISQPFPAHHEPGSDLEKGSSSPANITLAWEDLSFVVPKRDRPILQGISGQVSSGQLLAGECSNP